MAKENRTFDVCLFGEDPINALTLSGLQRLLLRGSPNTIAKARLRKWVLAKWISFHVPPELELSPELRGLVSRIGIHISRLEKSFDTVEPLPKTSKELLALEFREVQQWLEKNLALASAKKALQVSKTLQEARKNKTRERKKIRRLQYLKKQ